MLVIIIIVIMRQIRGDENGITSFEVREILAGCIVDNERKAHDRENHVKLIYDRNVIIG